MMSILGGPFRTPSCDEKLREREILEIVSSLACFDLKLS